VDDFVIDFLGIVDKAKLEQLKKKEEE